MGKAKVKHSAYWYAYHYGYTYSEASSLTMAYLDIHTYYPKGDRSRMKEFDSTFSPVMLGVCLFADLGLAMREVVSTVTDPAKRARLVGELRRDLRILRRPVYYARETERRRALAEARRKIARRTTLSPMPTPDQVLAAWNARKASKEAAIRLGGMLQDLECYVDNRLKIDNFERIRGRNGGIRRWLRNCLPELLPKYKTLMRYKAMAIRLRQATGTRDPKPTEKLLTEEPRHEVVAEILDDPRETFDSIWDALARRLDPERTLEDPPRAKAKEGTKSTVKRLSVKDSPQKDSPQKESQTKGFGPKEKDRRRRRMRSSAQCSQMEGGPADLPRRV